MDELVARWLADPPRPGYRLIVAHTHGHGDHVQGDAQFAGRPDTEVVGKDEAAERPRALPAARVAGIRDAAHAASRPGAYVHDDYIIWPGFGRGPVRRQRARYHLGRVVYLVRR